MSESLATEIKPWSTNPFTQAQHDEWMRCGAVLKGYRGHRTYCDRDKNHSGGHQAWRWQRGCVTTWWDKVVWDLGGRDAR